MSECFVRHDITNAQRPGDRAWNSIGSGIGIAASHERMSHEQLAWTPLLLCKVYLGHLVRDLASNHCLVLATSLKTLSPHQRSRNLLTYRIDSRNTMTSIFKSRSQPSSRRASNADLTAQPTNSEIFTAPEPGCQPKSATTYNAEQQAKVS